MVRTAVLRMDPEMGAGFHGTAVLLQKPEEGEWRGAGEGSSYILREAGAKTPALSLLEIQESAVAG